MNFKKQIAVTSVAFSLILLSGCSTNTRGDLIKAGYPTSYADGFDDGCHSGKQAAGSYFDKFKKDVRRFETDSKYGQGWSDGFRQCESKQEATARQTRSIMEMQRYNELRKENKWERRRHFNEDILKGIDTSGLQNLR